METVKSKDSVSCSVGWADKTVENNRAPRTHWDFKLYKNKADFDAGIVQDQWESDNIVTNQGKDALNDIMFHGATQITTWYVLLFSTNTTCVVGMTYAVPVFTESAVYDEATRPAYVEAASSSQSITNTASRAVFTMNDTATIYGCGLVGGGTDGNTKSDTAGGGTLYCASKFDSAKSVIATNVLSVGITITQS